MKENTSSIDEARAAKHKVLQLTAGAEQVNGVGITRVGNSYAVKVNLADQPTDDFELPSEVDGVPVLVEVVGKISKRPDTGGRKTR